MILRQLLDATDRGEPVVLVTVVDTSRSVPRHAGSKMLVYADGRTSGTIGGGEMESRVRNEAAAALHDGRPRRTTFRLIDPSSGDPGVCGGEVELYLEPYMPTPTVYVIGCGHVGQAVIELAHWMGFRTVAVDDRPELATAELLPLADEVVAGAITVAMERHPLTTETHVVVVTRNVAVDLEIVPHLVTSAARFIGVMGSRRRWATTAEQLITRGVTSEQLERVTSPIGLDLNAETPAEIAVSIMAQIVRERRAG